MAEAVDILKDRIRELENKINDLESDNKKQRDEIRSFKEDIDTKETLIKDLNSKLPAEGTVILSKADAARWDIAKAVAEKQGGFDKLETLSTERDQALKDLAAKARNETITKAGFDAAKFNRLFNNDVSLTGEGDDLTLELTVLDGELEKKVSIFELAESEGITDLVNAARISDATSESQQKPQKVVVSQANERTPKPNVITTEMVKEEIKSTGNYDF